MEAIKRFAKIVGLSFVGTVLVAACIFPFTSEIGVRGFASVMIAVSAVGAAVGALMLMGAGGNRVETPELDRLEAIDPQAVHEMRKDMNRGSSIGMLIFYVGAVCAALSWMLYRAAE